MAENKSMNLKLVALVVGGISGLVTICVLQFTPVGPALTQLFIAVIRVTGHPITLVVLMLGAIAIGIVGLVCRNVSWRRMIEEWLKK